MRIYFATMSWSNECMQGVHWNDSEIIPASNTGVTRPLSVEWAGEEIGESNFMWMEYWLTAG